MPARKENLMGMKESEVRICPKCGKEYTERPAMSREDNATPICPDCGTLEALQALGVPAQEQERIIQAIHKARRRIEA